MKQRIKILFLLLFIVSLTGCKSLYVKHYDQAKLNYDQDNYNVAVSWCLLSLELNNEYEDAHILLEQSYNRSLKITLDKIKKLKSSKQPKFYWDDVYYSFYYCIELSDKVTNSKIPLKESMKLAVSNYEDDLYSGAEEAKNKATEQHYQEGIMYSKSKVIDDQKKAAKQFFYVLKYSPDYKDAQELYDKCKKNAIKRIAIIPFEDKTNKQGRYGDVSGIVVDNISSNLLNDSQASEFIELISRTELENVINELNLNFNEMFDDKKAAQIGKLLHVNEIIIGKITQIIYTPERTSEKTRNETQNVVVAYKITGYNKDGSKIEEAVWRDVHATVIIKKKTSMTQILGSFQVIEVETGKIKKNGACNGKEDFGCEWATLAYGSDERALSFESKQLIQKSEEFSTEDDMVSKAVTYLSQNLYGIIREYTK